jgi:hypothetical protein
MSPTVGETNAGKAHPASCSSCCSSRTTAHRCFALDAPYAAAARPTRRIRALPPPPRSRTRPETAQSHDGGRACRETLLAVARSRRRSEAVARAWIWARSMSGWEGNGEQQLSGEFSGRASESVVDGKLRHAVSSMRQRSSTAFGTSSAPPAFFLRRRLPRAREGWKATWG